MAFWKKLRNGSIAILAAGIFSQAAAFAAPEVTVNATTQGNDLQIETRVEHLINIPNDYMNLSLNAGFVIPKLDLSVGWLAETDTNLTNIYLNLGMGMDNTFNLPKLSTEDIKLIFLASVEVGVFQTNLQGKFGLNSYNMSANGELSLNDFLFGMHAGMNDVQQDEKTLGVSIGGYLADARTVGSLDYLMGEKYFGFSGSIRRDFRNTHAAVTFPITGIQPLKFEIGYDF